MSSWNLAWDAPTRMKRVFFFLDLEVLQLQFDQFNPLQTFTLIWEIKTQFQTIGEVAKINPILFNLEVSVPKFIYLFYL
jgi:flagellar biosynthesis protein FlhB